jgi:hypothetical protein
MNDTQWLFSMESANYEESLRQKEKAEWYESMRQQVAYMLGLRVLPVEDPETHLLRWPTLEESVPLSMIVGREDFVQKVIQSQKEMLDQEVALRQVRGEITDDEVLGVSVDMSGSMPEMTPEELQAFMEDEGDVEFESNPDELSQTLAWAQGNNKLALENLVMNLEDFDNLRDVDGPVRVRTLGQTKADMLQRARRGTHENVDVSIENSSPVKGDMKITEV